MSVKDQLLELSATALGMANNKMEKQDRLIEELVSCLKGIYNSPIEASHMIARMGLDKAKEDGYQA